MQWNAAPLALGEAMWLVSWWKPILMLAPLLGWAWVVSTVYDKDAARWYFKRSAWNIAHIAAGTLAVAVVLFMPAVVDSSLVFWISWPIMLLILAIDLGVYAFLRNKDERVPESARWTLDPAKWAAARAERKKRGSRHLASSLIFKGPGGELAVPAKDTPEFETRVTAEGLIQRAFDARASQLDILPAKEGVYAVTILVDGVRQALEQMPTAKANQVMDVFKAAAGLDLADRRRKLVETIKIGPPNGTMRTARVTSIGTSAGMRLSVLIDPEKQVSMRVSELGLHPNQEADLRELIADRSGVVLIAAPPDNGRTATFYAVLREHDAYTSNVQTVETEPQATFEGIRQNIFDPAAEGAEHSTLVRSILRRDPDVVGIADMPDEATAKEVARADVEHCRVYLGLRADDPLKAIQLFVRAVGDQKQGAKGLRGVICQRLLRRLCGNCRAPFTPTPDLLRKLGLPADTKQLYRKSGQVLVRDKPTVCPACGGSGFFGQIGAFAVHTLGEEERGFIGANDLTSLRNALRQKKQQSIQTAALQHVVQGNTSVEEVLRVVQGEEQKPAAQTQPAPAAR